MTSLPNLPANLDPACVSCGSVSALSTQLTAGIAGQFAQVQGALASQTAGLQSLVNQVSTANAATRALIEAAISQDVINRLLAQYTTSEGITDIQCVADELVKISNKLEETNEATITASQLPPITVGGLLASLLPPIPVPDIPSPAEIKEYIVGLIERKKQEQRDAIVKLQKAKAEADNISFALI